MIRRQLFVHSVAPSLVLLAFAFGSSNALAAQVNGVFTIDTAEIIDLFSATFDGAINPNCSGASDAAECAFFGGQPPTTRAITFAPQLPATASGTLDVEYEDTTGEILQVNSLRIDLPDQILNIQGTTFVEVVQGNAAPAADDAIFAEAGTTAPNGTADPDESAAVLGPSVFEHDDAPNADVPDFATFNDIVDLCHDGSRVPGSGPLCGLISILTLDGIRYRITGALSGSGGDSLQLQTQTANNSIYKINFTTGAPEITVTDSVTPANDLTVPFGSITENTTANQTVTITNDGTATLNVGNLGNADALAPPFSLTTDMCTGQALAPSASCNATVTFAPTGTGVFNDSFNIPSDDADESSVTVSVSGTGAATPIPDIDVVDSVAPADDLAIPFGSITINQSATPATITVSNNGNTDLLVGQIAALIPPFGIAMDNCSNQTVMAAGGCTLMVTFMPVTEGNFNETVDIPSDDPDSPNVTVAITGTGAPLPTPDINVMDVNVDFGSTTTGDTRMQTVVVANDGTANLTIGTVAMADPLAVPFSLAMDGCSGQVLVPTASCMLDVDFSPTVSGAANDSFDIPSDDPDEPSVTVNLSGIGSDPATFAPVPSSPEGSDSGFFGMSVDLLSLSALLAIAMGYRARRMRLKLQLRNPPSSLPPG